MMAIDALGRTVALPNIPQRIVSLVPSLTEYLFDIGAGARVVGVTDFCKEPAAQVASLPKVRGTKNPDRARIAELQPDLVLASKEENRQRDVDALTEAGVPVYVTDICSVADALEQLTVLAQIVRAEAGAAHILNDMQAAIHAIHHAQEERQQAGKTRVLAFIWRDPWMAVGEQTYANDLLHVCGAYNQALHLSGRYPRADLDTFMHLNPEVIVLPDEPYRFGAADLDAFAVFPTVQAVQSHRIHLCDGTFLTWYGKRTVQAIQFFSGLL